MWPCCLVIHLELRKGIQVWGVSIPFQGLMAPQHTSANILGYNACSSYFTNIDRKSFHLRTQWPHPNWNLDAGKAPKSFAVSHAPEILNFYILFCLKHSVPNRPQGAPRGSVWILCCMCSSLQLYVAIGQLLVFIMGKIWKKLAL